MLVNAKCVCGHGEVEYKVNNEYSNKEETYDCFLSNATVDAGNLLYKFVCLNCGTTFDCIERDKAKIKEISIPDKKSA